MRKFFTTLKSVVAAAVVASMTLAASCSYDDTGLKNQIEEIKVDLAALAQRVAALEENLQQEIPTLEELLDGKSVIVNVTTDEDGNTIIELSNGKTITVLGECKYVPCDHECQPCDCDNLQYRVVDGVLEVSADGENWIAINGVAADQVVADVVISEDGKSATIVLADGQEFTVVKAELIEFEATRSQVYVIAGQSKEIPFAINDAVVDINVMNQPFGWSAEVVEAAANEGDNGDAGIMPLAAGGQNYILKINGPSQELVNAGYAAKEGVVSVHFNSANGGCKVARVNVNLAEITMTVDTAGNIVITNTMAMEQENYWGEKFVDFADFFIGIMPKSLYDEHGADALINDFQDWDYETAAVTQRSTGLWNVADLQTYEEGVYEKEVIEITVDRLAQAFYPVFNFEVGQEYIIFISVESELKNYYQIPVLDNAIMASYKKVLIEAELVADSAKWNDATYHMSLAGFQYYLIGWISVAEVEEYLSYGSYGSTVEEFLPMYIDAYGLMSSGAIVSEILDEDVNLSSLAERSLMEYAPEIKADTEYYFYVYPFNAASEMELYQHEFVTENLFIFENFKTNALVAGSFEVAPEYELVLHNEQNIQINVTLPEGVTNAYYTWFEAPQTDAEEALYNVMNDVYANATTELSFSAEKYNYNGLSNPIYFGLIAINEAGEYVYVEQEFTYVEPEPIALNSFEYLGRYYDLYDEDESTSGGDFIYKAVAADGQEFTIGLYYTFANEDGSIINGTYNYRGQYLNSMYSYWNGFVIESETYYDIASLIVTDADITLKLNGQKYVYAKEGGEPVDPEQPVEVTYDSADATGDIAYSDYYVNLHGSDGSRVVLNFYGISEYNTFFIPAGTYDFGGWSGAVYTAGYSRVEYSDGTRDNINNGTVVVAEVDGKYRIEVNAYIGDANTEFSAVYEGAIDGLILPSEYVAPEPEPEPEPVGFAAVRAELDNKMELYEYNGGDAEYAFWLYDEANNYIEVVCKFGPHTSWDYQYSAALVKDGVRTEATEIATQAPSDYGCDETTEKYFAVVATFADNTYVEVKTQLPYVEVNYFGEGSTYAPGSENQGGNDEGGNDEGGNDEGGNDEDIVIVDIQNVTVGYDQPGEKEVQFWFSATGAHVIDFKGMDNCTPGQPLVAGTYSSAAYTIDDSYCIFDYGTTNGSMTDIVCVVTDNADGTQTYDAQFTHEGVRYGFVVTSAYPSAE